MNLSKSEKLLAAKKKLREFQMSKMTQDASVKQKHVTNSSPQDKKVENDKPITENMNDLTTQTSNNNMNKYMQNVEQNQEVITNVQITAENTVNFEEHTLSGNVKKSIENLEEISQTVELERKELKDIPKVQKEHLLEMASAVAEVLTNDLESSETAADSELSCHKQFLSSYLEEQKKMVEKLHVELSNAHSRISEMEAKLNVRERDFQEQLAREINPLQEQLQIHAQTTGILIAEKAELTAALNQMQQSARQSSDEAAEATTKLKNSQMRVMELEKEMSVVKNNNEELTKSFNHLQSEYESLDKNFFTLKKDKEDLSLEVSELKQKLNLKKTELIATQQDLQEKSALLSLSELRIQQMKGATSGEDEKHTVAILEQELAQTKELLRAVINEKDEANKQYQNYVRQLDTQQAKLSDEIKILRETIENLQQREASYVQRLSELEQQLQQEREKVESLSQLQQDKYQVDDLLKNIDELTLEQEKLHIILSDRDSKIEMLNNEIQDLREANNQGAEVSKLATALESEQLGASRAVHQNRQLKEQLTDMENAFVSLSNAKLDLTEQLQAERSIGRKLNARLNDVESELEHLKRTLSERDAMLEEFEKERLQTAQITDQMQHYQAQSRHADTFQSELQHALSTIERLEKEKQALIEKMKETNRDNTASEVNSVGDVNDNSSNQSQELNGSVVQVEEPVKQLEHRFKETMERVAELTEEKQKLEHLVLQLQSETETIGEYITLYQKQRAVLQSRAKEREQVFRELLEQRNHQQEQLHRLKILVSDLINKEHVNSNDTEHIIEKETNSNNTTALKDTVEVMDLSPENKQVSELLDMLTEIKDCKDSCLFDASFHPCPWCSGKLLTV